MKIRTMLGLKLFLAMCIGFLGMGLMSCSSTQSSAKETHPEGQYAGGFGGNGEHVHELHNKKTQEK